MMEPGTPETKATVWIVVVAAVFSATGAIGILLIEAMRGTDSTLVTGSQPDITVVVEATLPEAPEEAVDADTDGDEAVATRASTTTATVTTRPPAAPAIAERSLLGDAWIARASGWADDGVDACGSKTTYYPEHVLDGRGATAWRVPGSGRGAFIVIELESEFAITEVGLIPGYAKVDGCDGLDRFFQNRRIEEVRWEIDGTAYTQTFDPARASLQLARFDSPVVADRIVLEIVEATSHGGRDFAAISDIEIRGG